MITEVDAARRAALERVGAATTLDGLTALHTELLGRRSDLAALKQRLGSLEPGERKAAGQAVNDALAAVEAALGERRAAFAGAAREAQIEAERLDLTEAFDSYRPRRGHLHLVTQTHERLEDVFVGLGFTVAEGPEVETDWYNFAALNMPPHHPARSDVRHDLRRPRRAGQRRAPHPHVTRADPRHGGPAAASLHRLDAGTCFRRDTPDATHMPVFHQIEGLVVDHGITFADLAGTIEAFTHAYFGPGYTSRLRPSYFPFTEPSAEFDIQRPDGSWLELGGCGMVHPNVLRNCGVDPEEWSGFAFGFGTDRMPMMRHGSTTSASCSPTTSASWSSSDAASCSPGSTTSRRVGTDAAAIAEELSALGLAVEEVVTVGAAVDGVIVARVLGTRAHPDADKVQLVDVDAGDGEALQIVCGAFNMAAGDLVPLATLGTVMPDGMEIGRRKMRGEWSNGMLCSPRELGLGDEHGGILILPPGVPVGTPVSDALGVTGDVVFDLDVNANRPDAWCHRGVARDLAAHRGVPFHDLAPPATPSGPRPARSASPSRPPTSAAGSRQRCSPASRSAPPPRGWPSASPGPACGRSTTWSTCPTT